MGHSEVDIDLYCNAEKFDYKNVERLLWLRTSLTLLYHDIAALCAAKVV